MSARTASLPSQPTPFVGRIEEIAEIIALLTKPTCDLLTLLGPGGIGKSRLAMEVAALQEDVYSHGVYYVPLQAVRSTDFLVSAVADALGYALSGQEELAKQLINYLRGKELLLVLDNFEQLLADNGEALLTRILSHAPGVKLLVTSRMTLKLQEEWIYFVQGLSFPREGPTDTWTDSDSVHLFNERARRVRQDFSLIDELDDVVRICSMVEGSPLAIELAAAWTKMLKCNVIADEIARNVDILTTSHQNVPRRQHSMRAVFDQTWRQLSQDEREVFKRLSIFQGSFQLEAAEHVAGASFMLLSMLQDKSLLRWSPEDNYHIHELLRQYAAEQLAQSATELTHIQDLHCAYFADFLHERNLDFTERPQLEALAQIAAELENIRAAWQWAVQQNRITEIKRLARPLGIFHNLQSRYSEGLNIFENVTAQLADMPQTEQTDLAMADILMAQAWLQLRFGRLDEIEDSMAQSQAIYQRLDTEPGPGYVTDPAIMLGFVALIRGDYLTAIKHAERARLTSERHNYQINQEFAYFLLAQAALAQGQYEAAQDFAQQAYVIGQAAGDRWFAAYILNTLGDVSFATKAYSTAERHYEDSYAIRQEFNDAEGMAVALNRLSEIALRQERYPEAHKFFEQSLQLYQDIDDKGGLATSYNGLGYMALAQGDYITAWQYYCQALQLDAEISFVPNILTLLVGIGELFCHVGLAERGIVLFVLVQNHSATNQETRDRAERLLSRYRLQVRSEDVDAAISESKETDLESTIERLLIELPTLDLASALAESEDLPSDDPNQALVEPLTARELDVLRLLADGLSNREIADHLMIAEGTVKYYTRQVYGKLQVHNRVQAVTLARELRLV